MGRDALLRATVIVTYAPSGAEDRQSRSEVIAHRNLHQVVSGRVCTFEVLKIPRD